MTPLRPEDFDFDLPEELIAQYPPGKREDARLMLLDRRSGAVSHRRFPELLDLLRPGDLLVGNDTRVLPARLQGRKQTGGEIEVLLVRRMVGEEEDWACLTRSSKPPREGMRLVLEEEIEARVIDQGPAPYRRLRFFCAGNFLETLERVGRMPLPPYIRRPAETLDRDRYQTVFASAPGAAAAPTAGLHFTPEILARLGERGVDFRLLTLHVGIGTFTPVRSGRIEEHRMHEEFYRIPAATAGAVNRARREGRRIVAVGTTSLRALESAGDEDGRVDEGEGTTKIFIYPGYRFRVVDGLVTNFHLPRSTLLMLVAALAGRDEVLAAYRAAVASGYRFFSYGDCMAIL